MNPIIPFEPVKKPDIPQGSQWLSQVKWDGVRILVYFNGYETRLYNRKKNERTLNYPELTEPEESYCSARSVILDGEMIALGNEDTPDFHEVMKRDGIRRVDKVKSMRRQVSVFYMIFDVIYVNGEWIHRRSLEQRQEVLADIIQPTEHVQRVSSEEDGKSLFDAVKGKGMEGVVAKRKDAPYVIGGKKDTWVKVKNTLDLIAVIGGFTLNGGVVNALLLGLYDGKRNLHYIGHTGSGKVSQGGWLALTETLRPRVVRQRPFVNRPERDQDAYWVRPQMTVKVKFIEWTKDDSMRQPTIEEFVDIDPYQCVWSEDLF